MSWLQSKSWMWTLWLWKVRYSTKGANHVGRRISRKQWTLSPPYPHHNSLYGCNLHRWRLVLKLRSRVRPLWSNELRMLRMHFFRVHPVTAFIGKSSKTDSRHLRDVKPSNELEFCLYANATMQLRHTPSKDTCTSSSPGSDGWLCCICITQQAQISNAQ